MKTVLIESRFCGPPASGNGGYACGLAAKMIGDRAEVRLRKPIPLNCPLQVVWTPAGTCQLRDGEEVIVEAARSAFQLEVPAPPSAQQAAAASKRYAGFAAHVFPTCFVCGPQRAPGDGLNIFAGPVENRELIASPWTPESWLEESNRKIRSEFIWAALDCPGAFAFAEAKDTPVVLGTLTARIERAVFTGELHTVIGWPLGREGRKRFAGTAIYAAATGELCAYARAIWIEIAPSK